jgi:Uma2 family endonuclease
MSVEITPTQAQPIPAINSTDNADLWDFPQPPTDLIFDDGEPLETHRHWIAINLLIASALAALPDQPPAFVGGNMFVYYSQEQVLNQDFRGPDFFVVLDVAPDRERQGWVVWQEAGRYPDVIVELLSPSTATVDRTTKKQLYERTFRTPDYFIFDPFDPTSFQGWHLEGRQYQLLPLNEQGWLWCETLGLWLGPWEGTMQREPANTTCAWLRFYDAQGNLVLLPEEAERLRADQAQQRADEAQQRADEAQQRADRAEQEKAVLLERLRAQGIDPETLLG